MVRKFFILFVLLTGFVVASPKGYATTFTAKDDAFTLDLPSGWKTSAKADKTSILAVEKGLSSLEIKTIDCTTETCIETRINNDLTEIKRKKMQVVGNSYTGEDIKRIEFSTGEPFLYISFYTPKNDFGSGYFLINHKAYSVLARNLTYAETDLIFSFISPRQPVQAPETQAIEMNVQDPRAYDIATLPDVTEEKLSAPTESAEPALVVSPTPQTWRARLHAFQQKLVQKNINTLISKRMPPYVQQLGRGFDVIILLGVCYILLLGFMLLVRLCKRAKRPSVAANPNSLYPIHFERLYGTPSLIFRARDNQGNTLVSLSSRWDSLFLLSGISLIIFTCLALATVGICERGQLLPFSAFVYDSIYSICSLLIPLGIVIFFCGIVWSQLVLREIILFDRSGKKAAIALQKGFGLTTETYEVYFARSKEVRVAIRKRFSLRRTWRLESLEGQFLAQITERSYFRAILRKLCGHLWGFLRADYNITGQMDSVGTIDNTHAPFNRFMCCLDKPQAINARDLLVLSLLINIRDRDKWYPWFN